MMALKSRSSIALALAPGLLLCGFGCNDAEKPSATTPPVSLGKMEGGAMGKMESGKMDKMESGKMDKMEKK